MELIESHLDTRSEEFQSNAAHHRALAAELKRHLEAINCKIDIYREGIG